MKKKVLLILGLIIGVFFIYRYFVFDHRYIFELKSTDKIEIEQVLDYEKDSVYISKERFKTDVPLKKTGYSQFKYIRKGILKDSTNTIFFIGSTPKGKKRMYKIDKANTYNAIDGIDLKNLAPLYYTALPNEKEFKPYYYKLNGYENTNERATNPKIKTYKKELYLSYFFKNFTEIFCWSLSPFDCNPRARKAVYVIEIQLKNQTLKIKSKGTSKYAYLNVYYKNNPKTDDFVLVEYKNSLWKIINR